MKVAQSSGRLISREGFVRRSTTKSEDLPSQKDVQLCKEWLLKYSKKKHLPQGERLNSYYLKHLVEEAEGEYVTNGAFIRAAIDLGFQYVTDDGPNAYFHITLLLPADEWRRVKPQGFSRWLFNQDTTFAEDAKEDPSWPRKAARFIDFWWYLDRHWVSEEQKDEFCDAWELWAGEMAPRPDLIETDPIYNQECDFISYGEPFPPAPNGCTYLYALLEKEIVLVSATEIERVRVRYVGQTTSPTKRLRDHTHRPGSIERVKWIGGLLNNNVPFQMAIFDTVDNSMANFLEKAAIYAFCECETRWDDQLRGFPPFDDALLNIDK